MIPTMSQIKCCLIRSSVVVASAWLAACAIVDIREDVQYTYQSGQIAKPLATRITPGVTTKTWLLENLGAPDAESTANNGQLEYIYHYDEFVNTKTRILFLFYYRSSKIIPRQLIVALKDDVVRRVGPSYFETVDTE